MHRRTTQLVQTATTNQSTTTPQKEGVGHGLTHRRTKQFVHTAINTINQRKANKVLVDDLFPRSNAWASAINQN